MRMRDGAAPAASEAVDVAAAAEAAGLEMETLENWPSSCSDAERPARPPGGAGAGGTQNGLETAKAILPPLNVLLGQPSAPASGGAPHPGSAARRGIPPPGLSEGNLRTWRRA